MTHEFHCQLDFVQPAQPVSRSFINEVNSHDIIPFGYHQVVLVPFLLDPDTLLCFKNSDTQKARDIFRRDEYINDINKKAFLSVIDSIKENPEEIEKYLKMKTYVEWPNEISYYDTLSFEWKWRSDLVSPN